MHERKSTFDTRRDIFSGNEWVTSSYLQMLIDDEDRFSIESLQVTEGNQYIQEGHPPTGLRDLNLSKVI